MAQWWGSISHHWAILHPQIINSFLMHKEICNYYVLVLRYFLLHFYKVFLCIEIIVFYIASLILPIFYAYISWFSLDRKKIPSLHVWTNIAFPSITSFALLAWSLNTVCTWHTTETCRPKHKTTQQLLASCISVSEMQSAAHFRVGWLL